MTGAALLGLALDGLRRKLGRNLLTMSGVFIGVMALTLIVALGQGMTHLIEGALSGGESLRQVGISPGFGQRVEDDPDLEIEGEMSEARRRRLARAARFRARPRRSGGRRAERFDQAALDEIAALPHVESVAPIILERYRVSVAGHETSTTATLGVDVERRRLANRIIAGRDLSSSDAAEVLLHEYLAYRWGLVTEEQLAEIVGETIVLESLGNDRGAFAPSSEMIRGVLGRLDTSGLTEEEREALPRIVDKLASTLDEPAESGTAGVHRELTVVGVVRDLEPTDTFNVIEDGNARQVDVFLPSGTATAMFLESAVNREIGFTRALVMVDEAANAKDVETMLRDRGHTAFSVASVIERVETSLAALTLIVSFLTGIALLVAALGIVNTMVTSVLERRAEIGLWKAVGATSGQVRYVFVLEAGMIGLVGGLFGLLVAVLLMLPGDALATRLLATRTAFPFDGGFFHVPAWLALGGPVLATAVAVLASLYPAARAARTDPVKALRNE